MTIDRNQAVGKARSSLQAILVVEAATEQQVGYDLEPPIPEPGGNSIYLPR